MLGAIDYYSGDIINIFYTEGDYKFPVTDRLGALFAAHFTDQRSVGANLLTGSSFHGTQLGFMTNISYGNAILTLAYTNTSPGADMRSPWSSYPGLHQRADKEYQQGGRGGLHGQRVP